MNKFKCKIIALIIITVFFFNITSEATAPNSNQEKLFINKLSSVHPKSDNTTRILTYNLLSDSLIYGGANASLRQDGVISLLKSLSPDVLALQEMSLNWFSKLNSGLKLKYINTANTLIKSQMTALFYNSDRLYLLKYGEKHYTECSNPRLRRIVWAQFIDKTSLNQFTVINTHFNLSNEDNTTALIQCNELIHFTNKLQEICKSPVIIAGDFNTYIKDRQISQTASVYEILCASLSNTHGVAQRTLRGNEKSFANVTDHIFYRGEVEILTEGLISSRQLNRLSDHYPLYIDIKIN